MTVRAGVVEDPASLEGDQQNLLRPWLTMTHLQSQPSQKRNLAGKAVAATGLAEDEEAPMVEILAVAPRVAAGPAAAAQVVALEESAMAVDAAGLLEASGSLDCAATEVVPAPARRVRGAVVAMDVATLATLAMVEVAKAVVGMAVVVSGVAGSAVAALAVAVGTVVVAPVAAGKQGVVMVEVLPGTVACEVVGSVAVGLVVARLVEAG